LLRGRSENSPIASYAVETDTVQMGAQLRRFNGMNGEHALQMTSAPMTITVPSNWKCGVMKGYADEIRSSSQARFELRRSLMNRRSNRTWLCL
jgi:hypothetical protein